MSKIIQRLTKQRLKNIFKLAVFSFFFAILFFHPQWTAAQEASFYLSPSKGSYSVGSTFSVDVLISAEGISINAAQSTLSFSSDKLRILKVSKQGSIFSLWVEEPVYSNTKGTVSFLGGVPNPGFIGERGKVFTILFKAQSSGTAKISFSGEKILANDPYGTDIFSSSQGGTYSIVIPEEYVPPEEPEKPPPEVPVTDTEPPRLFDVIVDNEGDSTNPSPFLYFKTTDALSGISHYEVKIKEEVFKVKPGENFPWQTPNLAPDTYHITVKAVDRAGNVIESSAEIKIESIPIPQITTCPKAFNAGEEMLFIIGTASPNTDLIVFFEKEGELIKKWEISSDGEGDWSLAKEGLFRSGIYQITVQAIDSRGAQSYRSEPCFVKVVLGGISIGPLIISYRTLNLIALILFIILLAVIIYLLWRIKRTHQLIARETKDLKSKFYKEYNELRTDIERELVKLRKVKDLRPRSEKEETRKEQLLRDLADVERVLREELKDIEDIG